MQKPLLHLLSYILLSGPAQAHEAWVLSPREFEALAKAPLPPVFQSSTTLLLISVLAFIIVAIGLWIEEELSTYEERLGHHLQKFGQVIGSLALRVGLAVPLGLGAVGGLPRHGTPLWAEPTLFVPDMQLSLVSAGSWIPLACIALSVLLVLGFYTRPAALGVIGLVFVAGQLFGDVFLYSYAAHFVGPAILLLLLGSGRFSVSNAVMAEYPSPSIFVRILWPTVLMIIGANFIYLALALKLAHPTLLIAILEHAGFQKLGIPLAWLALVMMGVELIAGVLLMLGRLVRPIGLFLIFAFTLFSITLDETPLFHANLYALMLLLALFGARPTAFVTEDQRWNARILKLH